MFDNYEEITCGICNDKFNGRKTDNDKSWICPKCLEPTVLPLINEDDPIPDSVNDEIKGGRGNEDGD